MAISDFFLKIRLGILSQKNHLFELYGLFLLSLLGCKISPEKISLHIIGLIRLIEQLRFCFTWIIEFITHLTFLGIVLTFFEKREEKYSHPDLCTSQVAIIASTFVKLLSATEDSRHLMLINGRDSRHWTYLRN